MSAQPAVRVIRLCDLQPSQLFINQEKLSRVQYQFDAAIPQPIEPIPYKDLAGLKVMTDGHTRTFAAYLVGSVAVPAYEDHDDLDWEAYQICVDWCHAEGIYSIADLVDRVLTPEEYEVLWYDRCRKMQSTLADKREKS
jgi:hypothetical protein